MKNRIIFWENECLSENLFQSIVDLDIYKIVGKIRFDTGVKENDSVFSLDNIKKREDEWDYFIYAYPSSELLDYLLKVLRILNVDESKCFNLFDISIMRKPQLMILAKILRDGNRLYDRTIFNSARNINDYVSVTAEGLSFISNSTDIEIPEMMYETKKVWASDDMYRLGGLLKEYYHIDIDSEGCFFDIGANIGTTSIYVSKKILPNFMIHAFEPMKENFKMLKANFILNEVKNYEVNNVALSSVSSEYNMQRVFGNWGNCSITNESNDNTELVLSTTLDEYILTKEIDNYKNLVLWVDTEGFELDVLIGAKEILRRKPALFLEFNLSSYGSRVDELIKILEDNYTGFIRFDDADNIVINDMSILKTIQNQIDIFLIP